MRPPLNGSIVSRTSCCRLSSSLPTFGQIFSAANAYLDGAITIHELNGAVVQALATARLGGVSEPIVEYLEAWCAVINRRWNEFGTEEHPISEDGLRTWLREHLLRDSERPPANPPLQSDERVGRFAPSPVRR